MQTTEEQSGLLNPVYANKIKRAILINIIAFCALFWPIDAVQLIGAIVFLGTVYGVANDMIACRDCIEYFTFGHVFDGQNYRWRPLNSLDPDLNAIVWGMLATWPFCVAAGLILAICAQLPIPYVSVTISTVQVFRYAKRIAITALPISHIISSAVSKYYATRTIPSIYSKPPYNVPPEYQLKWLMCDVRNSTGYLALFLGTIVLSGVVLAARCDMITL